jgi:hypothetical protein
MTVTAYPLTWPQGFERARAREDAIEKLWPLLGFRLRDKLNAPTPAP